MTVIMDAATLSEWTRLQKDFGLPDLSSPLSGIDTTQHSQPHHQRQSSRLDGISDSKDNNLIRHARDEDRPLPSSLSLDNFTSMNRGSGNSVSAVNNYPFASLPGMSMAPSTTATTHSHSMGIPQHPILPLGNLSHLTQQSRPSIQQNDSTSSSSTHYPHRQTHSNSNSPPAKPHRPMHNPYQSPLHHPAPPKQEWDRVKEWEREQERERHREFQRAKHRQQEGESSRVDEQKPSEVGPIKSGRLGHKRRQKYSRSRTGCLGCRVRRIKCDEGRPVCKRCLTSKRPCQFPDNGDQGKQSGKDKSGSAGDSRDDSEESEEEVKPSTAKGKGKRRKSADDNVPNSQNPSFSLLPSQTSQTGDIFSVPSLEASDFGWDTSFVGSYDSPTDLIPKPPNNGILPLSGGQGLTSTVMVPGRNASGEIGKEDWNVGGGAPMLSTPNFLLPWFPTAEERSLILHYCANAADLMMAIPSGLNPMLAINLPLALDSPRGMNPSADALRVALLGIGAIHQAFLLARSGVSTSQTAAMFQHASNLRDTGKEMVRRAASVQGGGAGSDAALGAGTALATIDIFFGGSGWQDNFKLAKDMVAYRGGPAAMLKASTPTLLAEGVTVSPARLQLEILAIYETFGCLTTGQEPTLISDKGESWWFEGSRSTYEEHSVEKQFGMSRVMVHLFSRLARLLSRVARSNRQLAETDLPFAAIPTIPNLPTSPPNQNPNPNQNQNSTSPPNSNPLHPIPPFLLPQIDPLTQEARDLNKDLDAWIDSLRLVTLEHERVQVGNRAYAHAMKILLLRMVFGCSRSDPRVQRAAMEVLQHCSVSTAALGMSIDIMWPAIIAGCCVDGDSRQWLLTLLEGFKSQCCFDVETANRIIQEVWRRVDAGEQRADWKPVCEDFGLQVLLC